MLFRWYALVSMPVPTQVIHKHSMSDVHAAVTYVTVYTPLKDIDGEFAHFREVRVLIAPAQ